ncbi:enhancer of polycomb homolog 1-like isoform X1 [Myxocyprinus asiaticus]|uniref:enhancer of polycomb homolog 1-like isoform X1 n=1 Tax=Myxocyprinus asiaticus TaxID=70543 RepID=UPI0022215AAC|nr:enhancer of polycomb homolog 1-like isoform X1 [Myxocyprinus asiaticus]
MSKLSFRARALDASKPLPVFRCEDLPDLHEYASINRAVPQMPTGMEKEEESEHHLQRAISAQQVYGEKRDNMVIPVPEAESNIAYYESLYPGDFKMPKQLIHIQPFSLDTEQPDFDLDSDDDTFVNKLKKKMDVGALQFEEMIDRLEKGSGKQPVSLQEAKLLLKEDDELIKEVFEYWSRKRKACQSGSFIPVVKQEKRDNSSTSDPYIAFRRRTEKMQTRKNRKNDEASYEKMLKLRRDLSRAVTILEMIKRREKSKRELLHLTLEIVEKRNSMADFGGEVMAEVLAQRALEKPVIPLIPITNSTQYRHTEHDRDYKSKVDKPEVVRQKRKYEKKAKPLPLAGSAHSGLAVFNAKDLNQYDFPSSDDEPSQMFSGSSEVEEENDPDGVFAFRRRTGCQYHAVRSGPTGDWPWTDPTEGGIGDVRYRYSLTMLTVPRRCLGLARRRVGRGGRVLLDRAHSDWDSVYHGLDPDSPVFPSLSPSPLPSTDTSHISTDTSAPSSSPLDLTQLLLNIKACRWRHFKPRTAPPDDPDNPEHWSTRRPRRGFLIRPISTLRTRGGPAFSRPPAPAFNAEQYQQHQEQLALMQKQQLEQVQLQQQTGSTAVTNNPQSIVSKTIDAASAQFAASALVTPDQLMALKSKEEGVGVNGVVSASGVYKGLHYTSSAGSIHPSAGPISTSSPSPSATTNNGTSSTNHHVSTTGPAPAQALMGGAVRVSVSSPAGTLSVQQLLTVPTSALKLAANANRPIPKVTTGSTTLDMGLRENHDQEKPPLNSLADNTVAMEVT